MKSAEQKGEQNAVRIDTLSTDHIRSLQRQLGQQVEGKKKAVEVLLNTAAAFDQSKSAVQDLSKLNEGTRSVGANYSLTCLKVHTGAINVPL